MNGDALYARLPIPLQNVACTWAGWQRARARFTPHFHDCLARWSQSGWSSQETLLRIQQERLIALVRRARRSVPHYAPLDLPEPVADEVDPARGIARILDEGPAAAPAADAIDLKTLRALVRARVLGAARDAR